MNMHDRAPVQLNWNGHSDTVSLGPARMQDA